MNIGKLHPQNYILRIGMIQNPHADIPYFPERSLIMRVGVSGAMTLYPPNLSPSMPPATLAVALELRGRM